jgi:hypothetical protein
MQDIINFYVNVTGPESASELYRLSDLRVSAKLLPTFADRRFLVVSVTDPYGRIPTFADRRFLVVSVTDPYGRILDF